MFFKKIFIIIPHLGGGGAERSTLYLINNWVKLGYDVTLVLLKKKGALLKLLDSDIKIIDLDINRISKSIIPIYLLIKKNKPDVILTLMWPLTSVVVISWLLNFKKGKLFLVDHNPLIKNWAREIKVNWYVFIFIYNVTYIFCNGIICVSDNLKKNIKNILFVKKNNIFSIYNPVLPFEKEKYNYSSLRKKYFGNTKFCFLSVGRLKKSRGIENLLLALKDFEFLNQSKLVILGDGPEKNNIEILIKKYNLENNVILKGFIDNTYPWYYVSDIYIHTSIYDAMPLTLIEAITCGTKIISTDSESGPREILENGKHGILIPINNPSLLLKAINISLNEKVNEYLLKERSKSFSINKISNQYLKILFKN